MKQKKGQRSSVQLNEKPKIREMKVHSNLGNHGAVSTRNLRIHNLEEKPNSINSSKINLNAQQMTKTTPMIKFETTNRNKEELNSSK